MRSQIVLVALVGSIVELSLAAPSAPPARNGEREEMSGVLGNIEVDINHIDDLTGQSTGTDIFSNLLNDFKLIKAVAAPNDIFAARRQLSDILLAKPRNIVQAASELVAAGLTADNVESAVNFLEGALDGENSENNVNPGLHFGAVYPQEGREDAPYDLSEARLRGAIHIPPTFRYGASGAPQPVILVPGTGNTGYITFEGNYIKLLTGSDIADPVWLNIPGFLNDDVQTNAEYVAYAINYISRISNNREVAVVTWSQGGVDAQWALKYWPSTRDKVTDVVAFSPDYKGTINANFAETPETPLPPAYLQQEYYSNLVRALRSNGGDSAYVPTTTIYSGFFDEIVEPQQGQNASAYLFDARDVGVTNNEVQAICPGQPAGSFYSHEGTLYNPIGYALLVDALQHDGPGRVSRVDAKLETLCGDYLTPGLDLADFLVTENTLLVAAVTLLLNPHKATVEPAIKAYAEY
ncbi:Hypothetical predicted protein [Lecanosticta acicola]|uniref:Lipase B n=1 Tax=Lecanosticta acicola TaxID=111012 RepID=A0AAI9ECB8_9PEZI|nr:Hypothetical predicted protein [Lecanosticta acicola]